MRRLLSLPPNAVKDYHRLHHRSENEWFCTSDPRDKRLGSGSGTTWLLEECYREEHPGEDFNDWLSAEKRILIHAGGQSRRLPAYAVTGKISLPVPVFRWARGQRLSQDLLSLQLPLYEKIMQQSPASLRTLVVSGDVYIHSDKPLQEIPEADVVCYGLWVDASLATRHGVFAARRETPEELDCMLQKPSLHELENLSHSHFFLMDIGLWLLSDRAVELLRDRSYDGGNSLRFYDLYSDFGRALGNRPSKNDKEINKLSVKIVPLNGGEFYHYGTSREMISSTLALQNKVHDQRLIMHRKIKPNPAIFTQNAVVEVSFTESNRNIWIENAHIGKGWTLSADHVITGVPENDWLLKLPEGTCIDMVPVDETGYVIRPYGINDAFKGSVNSPETIWMGRPIIQWLEERKLTSDVLGKAGIDLQQCVLFPCLESKEEMEKVIQWMIGTEPLSTEGKDIWFRTTRFSADELMDRASLSRLYTQRSEFRRKNYPMLEQNYEKSVFYQLDLSYVVDDYVGLQLPVPKALPEETDSMQKIHNRMLRSRLFSSQGDSANSEKEESKAFSLLRNGLISAVTGEKRLPRLAALSDQIVWGRSPVRIDLAGGWTDTPPFSLYAGGSVVNIAIELNGQPPLQVYVKPCSEHHILLRSIDMGATEVVETYEELRDYRRLGSPFSIPRAALALCGFLPEFAGGRYVSLEEQLKAFGAGIEITLLSAIPAGSGLGTSSILAATVLGALNDFCGLQWNKQEIATITLVLEQLLTSGGGWQDQYGGILHGVKLLESERGFLQKPQVSWLPESLFSDPTYASCHLLYYTGITRVAKNILGEIVRSMFLNEGQHLSILHEMKSHALDMAECIQRGELDRYGKLVLKSWQQNNALDRGTNPPGVAQIIDLVKDYTLGYKLPGAGGGGYLYMVAKDPEAALLIRKILEENRPNDKARFVEMQLSHKGFQVSRS
ncbi:bifunctional fucokinase/fucose-1-phosphate guanylyltransferase [Proteiniphilum sp. UBA5384]|uniref:bifunctional fucokinase/fucose-1-phosphate guanylyltransferase n=1 Tax=Proteiniphilum sp. UBA5384 TaxID=1947279 RepID=UPI0025D4B8E0|nr:bifunctional fucokinase/fucose-1-phosphate guanylyltransferase [Proteiniphilum sp. UBA5384]